jgi:hypothetical protein
MCLLYAARVRRTILALASHDDIAIPDSLVADIIDRRIWRAWGYRRLGDCLMQELKLDVDETAKWVSVAIKKGLEHADMYRN